MGLPNGMMCSIFCRINFPKIRDNLSLFKLVKKSLLDKANSAQKQELALQQLQQLLFQEQKQIFKQTQNIKQSRKTHKRVKSDFVQKKKYNKNLDQFFNEMNVKGKDFNHQTIQPKLMTNPDENESFFCNDIDKTRLGGSFLNPVQKEQKKEQSLTEKNFASFQQFSKSLLKYSKNLTFFKNVEGHLDSVRTVDFLNDDKLITCGEDGVVQIHDLQNSFKQIIRVKGIPLCSFNTAQQFITANHKGLLNQYKILNNKLQYQSTTKTVEQEPIWSLTVQDSLLCSTSPDFIKFWEIQPQNLTLIQNWKAKEKSFVQSQFQDNTLWNSFCYKANKSKTFIQQLDLETQQLIQVVQRENQFANHFKILPQKNLLVSGNNDNSITLFDIKSGKLVQNFRAHEDEISCLDVSSLHGIIASGGDDDSVRIWDLRSLRCAGENSLHCQKFNKSIYDIKIHNSLKVLATAGADHTSKVFCFD